MAILVSDPSLEERLIMERKATGADRYDEVWEGIYMMVPMPDDEHQDVVTALASILQEVIGWPGLGSVRAGVNVTDRRDDWQREYRVPDVAVFLRTGQAVNLGTHWCGGPDLVIEIVSAGDRTREKVPFYQRIGAQELLVIDREPWKLVLYRHQSGELNQVCQSELDSDSAVTSDVVPLSLRLISGEERPRIEVSHAPSGRQWTV